MPNTEVIEKPEPQSNAIESDEPLVGADLEPTGVPVEAAPVPGDAAAPDGGADEVLLEEARTGEHEVSPAVEPAAEVADASEPSGSVEGIEAESAMSESAPSDGEAKGTNAGMRPAQASSLQQAWAALDEPGRPWHDVTGAYDASDLPESDGVSEGSTGVLAGFEPAGDGLVPQVPLAGLVGIGDICKGRRIDLVGEVLRVGRTAASDVVVEDKSVSRQHAVMERRNGQYWLTDEHSHNGTWLNGRRVERAAIHDGDEVGFGNALFRFEERASEGQVVVGRAQSEIADEASRTNVVTIAVSTLLIIGALVASGMIIQSRTATATEVTLSDDVFEHYVDGVEAFRAKRWDRAERHFLMLEKLAPDFSRTTDYLDAIGRERRASKKLATALKERDRGALLAADQSAKLALKSIYSESEARKLRARIQNDFQQGMDDARRDIEAGKLSEAKSILTKLSASGLHPDEVAKLHEVVEYWQKRDLKKETAPKPKASRSAKSVVRAELGRSDKALSHFLRGRLDDAAMLLRGAGDTRSQRFHTQLERFRASYDRGQREHRAKRAVLALKYLEEAQALEQAIAGGRSIFAKDIGKRMADMRYVQGVQAYSAGRYLLAYNHFQKALSTAAGHAPSTKLLAKLDSRAKAYLDEGDELRGSDLDDARARWKQVLEMVPATSTFGKQAKKRLR